jgi:hypothetical protein
MLGSLMTEFDIQEVWSLFSTQEGDTFVAINGARMSAVLAKQHDIPFLLFPHSDFPHVENGCFAGVPVSVEGSKYIEHELDRVRDDLVTEVF